MNSVHSNRHESCTFLETGCNYCRVQMVQMSSLHLNGFYFLKTVEFYMSLPNCLLNMIISQENLNGEPGGL